MPLADGKYNGCLTVTSRSGVVSSIETPFWIVGGIVYPSEPGTVVAVTENIPAPFTLETPAGVSGSISFEILEQIPSGSVANFNPVAGTGEYTPPANTLGQYWFKYQVRESVSGQYVFYGPFICVFDIKE